MKPLYFLVLVIFFSSSNFLLAQSAAIAETNDEVATNVVSQAVSIDLVMVEDAGNAPDKNGYGAVSQNYQIGKYDITARQYCAFLNAVAADDLYDLYDKKMKTDPTAACIERSGSPTNYSYSIITDATIDRGTLPITYVSYYSAMRFCNWLHNGQPVGEEGPETTETGAYTLNGSNVVVPANDNAAWRLPTLDEWYKAAYYKRGSTNAGYWKYPTQESSAPTTDPTNDAPGANYFFAPSTNSSNRFSFTFQLPKADLISIDAFPAADHLFLTPVGFFTNAPGPYQSYDMGGNVFQWTSSESRFPAWMHEQGIMVSGGCWKLPSSYLMSAYSQMALSPKIHVDFVGFRVAAPAPVVSKSISDDSSLFSTAAASSDVSLMENNTRSVASSAYHLTNAQKIALIATVLALLILTCWWLWSLLPEVSSIASAEFAANDEKGIEMVKMPQSKTEVAETLEELFSHDSEYRYDSNTIERDKRWVQKVKSFQEDNVL